MKLNLIDTNARTWGVPGSFARLSHVAKPPPSMCIVFLHGFRGDHTTWNDFPTLITSSFAPQNPYGIFDLFFYQYDWRANVSSSSGLFRQFVNALTTNPALDVVNPTLGQLGGGMLPWRANNFRYDHVFFCAHSLGAFVLRRALLDLVALNQNQPPAWMTNSKLVLFAPAHNGAHVSTLMQATFGMFGRLSAVAPAMLKAWFPVISDLELNSPALNQLSADHQRALTNHGNSNWLVANVVEAGIERVVLTHRFGQDKPSTPIANTDHVSVCKPKLHFMDPFTLLGTLVP